MFCLQALIRDEFEKTKVTLAESSRRKLEAAVASARAESDDAAKAAAHGLRREADGARRDRMRAHLEAERMSLPLFDTEGYARGLEDAFLAAHGRAVRGLAPADLTV